MLEVKKLRTLQRKGGEMDKTKVLEKTRKYLVSSCSLLRTIYSLSSSWLVSNKCC